MSNFRLKSRILEIIVVVATMAIVASSHAQSANIDNQLGVSEGLTENFIKEIHSAQSVADALRDQSGAELALVASGQIQTANSGVPLITSLLFQDESVWVVQLTGKQLREAFEKSAAFFPNSLSKG
jgi:hypothetical protein